MLSILLPILLLTATGIFAERIDNSSPLEGIFDTITPFINYANLIITYSSSGFVLEGDINSGTKATPNDTSVAPSSITITPFEGYGNPFFPINITQLYTLVMVDPDAPSRANPTAAQILHFVQTGLTITPGQEGTITFDLNAASPPAVPYRGPAPPVDTGFHRYIYLLFRQPDDSVDLASFSADNRRSFDVESFATNNTFGPPLAGAYFEAQNAANAENDTVPDSGDEQDTTTGGDTPGNEVEDPSVEDPLVIDTSTPTPPARVTGTATPSLSDISYDGTLTVSVGGPDPTSDSDSSDSETETDTDSYSGEAGEIGDWTMTAPGDMGHREIVTTTTTTTGVTATATGLELLTDSSSYTVVKPTATAKTTGTGDVAGVQEVTTRKPSSSLTTSWLDAPVDEGNAAVGRGVGRGPVWWLGGAVVVMAVVM